MKKKLDYSFDDEPVSKFCYDLDNNRIEIYFKGFFDLLKEKYVEKPCIWLIENWEEAKSKIGDDTKAGFKSQMQLYYLRIFFDKIR